MTTFTFNTASFNTLFPFYLLLRAEDLTVKCYGKSISKILPSLTQNALFSDFFTINRPKLETITPSTIVEIMNQLVVFTTIDDASITLKGQFIIHEDCYLFVGTPWFQSMENVTAKKLTIDDFAVFDPLLDLLHVLKNQEINNAELIELLQMVNSQRKSLKKDQEELNRLSLVASANKNGVVFTDAAGKIFWCNQSYVDLSGYAQDEIIGKTPIEVGQCELSSTDAIVKMTKAFYEKELFEVEGYHAHKNGKHFLAKIKGQPVFDKKGNLVQYFAIIENNTLEKEREEKLSILSSIAEKNSNAVVICDQNGLIEWVNDSFLQLTQFTLPELLGKKPGKMLQGPDTDPAVIAYLSAQIKKGLPFNVELINYSKDKKKYWIRLQGQPLLDKKGKVIKYFAVQEDITLQKIYHQKIIDSENKLNSLIENLQSGVLLEDEHRKIVIVNKKFCSLFSIPIAPELMKGFDCVKAAEEIKHFFMNPNEFISRIDTILKNKQEVIAEEIFLADGRIFERSFLPIYKDNAYAGHLWSYDDVTINKRVKESIEAERLKYSNIIANMNMGLLEVDLDDTILLANQSFIEMSGYNVDELMGSKASELFLNPQDKQIIQDKRTQRSKGVSDSYEVSVLTKDNTKKHWLISGAPNYNLNGELIGSIGIHLDITAQKNLELQKEQLLHKLEKQNEQLNEYAQIVSHDLKSPLRSIHSLITWIKEDNEKEFSPNTLQFLSMIESKIEKMDHLIDGILTYSKVDSEHCLNESVDLNDVVINCIKIIHVPETVSIQIQNKLPIIRADKFRMQQLFQNLISNGVNYIDKTPGNVVVGSYEKDNTYVFFVKDNGVGIAKEHQEKIFKIFQSFSGLESSTGIGLSIVKRIVDNYKGRIRIESELHNGTTFFIYLPKTIQ